MPAWSRFCLLATLATATSCQRAPPSTPPEAPTAATSIVLVTIDTLRADRVGAYGWSGARTAAIDALARQGALFERAFATAPITLTSHASLLTGVYPPRHGARHNGMRVKDDVPTLATILRGRGFRTGAFVAAFPLDHRFGLNRGFETYSDVLPRGPDGRLMNERPGGAVVDDALAWLSARSQQERLFLWVHLFEPHAPYEADPSRPGSATRSISERYDDEIARADGEVARLIAALEPRRASTLIVVAGDHGEAFGEHGEVGHSVFVYDTTLRVPLVIVGPGVRAGARPLEPVSLVDVMPTMLGIAGITGQTVDGRDLRAAVDAGLEPRRDGATRGRPDRKRVLYAESFAPLLDFGWSSLRSVRVDDDKYIAAPKPELYDVGSDIAESKNLAASKPEIARTLAAQLDRWSPAELPDGGPEGRPSTRSAKGPPDTRPSAEDQEALARLRSLGYLASSGRKAPAVRADPKDRIELAARIAEITSGELQGGALRTALERIVREDPANGQMQMRLGFVLQEAGECRTAMPRFEAAIAADVPSAEPRLGLAECLAAAGRHEAARRVLLAADRVEPGNPLVSANLGMLALDEGNTPEAIVRLRSALSQAPDLHQARFALARAYGRAGQRDDAVREARELLARLPANAPQRSEVERLIGALQ